MRHWISESQYSDSLYYVDSDHLGSILALIRNNGSQAAEYSYDEWGKRRRPSNWNLYDSIPNSGFIDRGYTGHEHYDQFGLIDMNGRVYDPIIGRFLSPDPVIQSPDYTQNYNGYSYCLNNPLKYSDPTGFSVYYDPWTQQDGKYHSLEEQQAAQYGDAWYNFSPSLSDIYGGSTYREIKKEAESNPDFDVAKAIDYLIKNEGNLPTRFCAREIIYALAKGGITVSGHAWQLGNEISRKGFYQLSTNDYSPQNGDITVFDINNDHPYGHVQMFCNGQWISDFKQGWVSQDAKYTQYGSGFNGLMGTTPTYTIYRFNWYNIMR
jgi:RHS repeat-associated protein